MAGPRCVEFRGRDAAGEAQDVGSLRRAGEEWGLQPTGDAEF